MWSDTRTHVHLFESSQFEGSCVGALTVYLCHHLCWGGDMCSEHLPAPLALPSLQPPLPTLLHHCRPSRESVTVLPSSSAERIFHVVCLPMWHPFHLSTFSLFFCKLTFYSTWKNCCVSSQTYHSFYLDDRKTSGNTKFSELNTSILLGSFSKVIKAFLFMVFHFSEERGAFDRGEAFITMPGCFEGDVYYWWYISKSWHVWSWWSPKGPAWCTFYQIPPFLSSALVGSRQEGWKLIL